MQQLSPRIAAAEDSLARLEWAPDTADEDELEATRAHLRTAHGALVSTKRAKERKLRALKREFQLLREQGRDTPADRRESDGRVARQAELLGQVEEAESTLAAEEQYHAVLESMLYARRPALDHATEELEDLRGWLKSFGRQREKLSRMGA